MAQGAVQIEVVLNGYNITVQKSNLVSLKVKRVIGDSANEFTLEAFDETAFDLERALIGNKLAPISIRYCMADNLNNALTFTGTCIDYQITFTGRATMISITGILAAAEEIASGFTFAKQAIEWCGSEILAENGGTWGVEGTTYSIDGKSSAVWNNYKTNEDVCAIVKIDENKNPVAYFNPTRIFKRIIHKYNKDTLGSSDSGQAVAGWGTGGSGIFKLSKSKVKESRWIPNMSTRQEANQTTPEYIVQTLAKYAITETNGKENDYTGEIAGYKYWIDSNGHNFYPLNYSNTSSTTKLLIKYGMRDSNVISFSVSNVGAIAMCGIDAESRRNAQKQALLQNSSLDYLYGSDITSGSDNIEEESAYENWYFSKNITTQAISSSNSKALSTITKTGFDGLESMIYSAELTIWGDIKKKYSPGDFIDIIVTAGKDNIRHYSSGVYMILSIDDSLSQDGFTQSMKLLKNTSAISTITEHDNKIKQEEQKEQEAAKESGTSSYTPVVQGPPAPNTNNTSPNYNRPLPQSPFGDINVSLYNPNSGSGAGGGSAGGR